MTLSFLSLHSVKCIHSTWEITSIYFPVVLLLALGDTPLWAREEGATSGATLSQLAVYSLYPLRKSLQTYFQSEGNIYTFPQCFPFKDFQMTALKMVIPSVVSLVRSDMLVGWLCWHFPLENIYTMFFCLRIFRCWNYPHTRRHCIWEIPLHCLFISRMVIASAAEMS